MSKKNVYAYAYGKFFETEEEFLKFCSEWPDTPFDLEEFKHQMSLRIQEAELNSQIRGGKMTNREVYQILRMSTDWALDKCTISSVTEEK